MKQTKVNKNIQTEIGRKSGHSWQSARVGQYLFDILLKSCMLSPFSDRHKDMPTIVLLGSLIPPLTAEVSDHLA